jgi:signal transduction histidine kinase
MSFRAKILLTFVFVSVIPLAVMTLYNREYAVERAEQQMVRMLSDETDRVVGILQSDYAIQTPFDLARLRDADCTEIAEKASTDFNLYGTRELLASSRPEVFVSELIDRRLSGAAFRSIALDRLSFYSERQSIGTLEYVVGYRPLLSSAGEVIGVVSVHTLYRQQEVDNEAVSRNSYLFGAYAMSCLIAVGLGLVFSRRISSPIRRLQVATRRIAAGDLNISLRSHRTDELGELEQAFDTMASDLKAHQERIIRTERELAWREMAKQVAHEIKNPLTPMQLSVQHLRRAYEDGARDFGSILAHVSQVLLDQIETLSRIATEFSRFARMPDRRPVPCDVHQLLADASDLFAQHPGVTLTTSLAAEQMTVLADVEELRRAFVNILRNAVQAMAEHGSITIETEQSGERIVIGITDSGPGISDSVKENLFKPNFSTKTEGMGLGLAIVKKTIDDLQGDIRIESEPGKGTTVRITLPVLMPPVR